MSAGNQIECHSGKVAKDIRQMLITKLFIAKNKQPDARKFALLLSVLGGKNEISEIRQNGLGNIGPGLKYHENSK
jgi:hypothetical protein